MKNNNNIIELSAYTQPSIKEDKRNEWVTYGEKNSYYQFLIDAYLNSATNNAVINNISRLVYGKGLNALDSSTKPNEYAQLITLLPAKEVRNLVNDLKLLGQCAIQVHYDKKHSKILKCFHIPIQLLAPEKCDENGDINNYYYSDDWSDVKKYIPNAIPAFGTSKEEIEILVVRPYSVGKKYFSNVDYQGCLDYCVLEEKISEYLINEVSNGFSPTTIVNFNNGQPTDEQKDQIASQLISKLTGSTGKKVVVSFNDSETTKTTIDTVPLNDAPEHYKYLSEECLSKIMVGHNVTSPLMFGIATSTGFSSNADELKNSYILFDNMVIRPMQDLLIDAFDSILAFNQISLRLYFQPLQPFIQEYQTPEEKAIQEQTKLSSHIDEIDLTEVGEEVDLNEWVLVDSRKVNYDEETQLDEQIEALNNPKQSLLSKVVNFVSTGTARPNTSSQQDGQMFKTRYRYNGDISGKSREFCKKMIAANKVYRKEDIVNMGSQVVNETRERKDGTIGGLGAEGSVYVDVWLYKGGGACHHYWTRETYLRKSDVNSPLAKKFTPSETRKAGEIAPVNDKRVYQRPIDMPNKGFLPK